MSRPNTDPEIIDPAHTYRLPLFEDPERGIFVHFIKKETDDEELVTVHDGTTNEAVLKMLIHRLNCLAEKLPSKETTVAIRKLDEALQLLDRRTRDRIARGVEGTHRA